MTIAYARPSGGLPVTLGQQGVAEPGQRVPLAETAHRSRGRPRWPWCSAPWLGDVPQVQVDVADAVQGVGGAAAVPGVAVQAQRPLAVGQRRSYWPRWAYSQPTPSPGWPGSTSADGLEHPQCVQRDGQRLGVAFLLLQHAGQAVEHHGFVGPVTELAELIERPPEVRVGVGVRAVCDWTWPSRWCAWARASVSAQPGGRGQRDLLGRGVVLPPAARLKNGPSVQGICQAWVSKSLASAKAISASSTGPRRRTRPSPGPCPSRRRAARPAAARPAAAGTGTG